LSFFGELKRRNVIRVGATYVVIAWLVIQVAETIFPLFKLDDSVIRLIVIALAAGFIPTLIGAWAFELTPDGFRRDNASSLRDAIAPKTSRKFDSIIMLALALALGLFAFDKFVLDPQRDADLVESTAQKIRSDELIDTYKEESVAVLPFTDMSQYGNQQYLSDGFAEEVLNILVKVPGLRVASRTSTFNLRDENLSVTEIAQRLNVTHILEGSIRLVDNKLRVTVQLIDARSDTHLWSENYNRIFDDIFSIQDDIAIQVAHELEVNLFPVTNQPEDIDPEAHNLYLQAAFLFGQADPEDCPNIIDLLTRAVAIDSNYFKAWFMLGDIYQRQVIWEVAPREAALKKSREANRHAAKIRPNSVSIYYRMGWMALRWDEDLEQAAIYIQQAVDLTEDPIGKVSIANDLLRQLGRTELLIKLGEFNVQKYPTNAQYHWNLAQDYLDDGQYKKSASLMKTALTLSPGIDGGNGFLARALLMDGLYQGALEAASNEELDEMRLPITLMSLDALNRDEEAEQVFLEMSKNDRVLPVSFAEVYTQRGDTDGAFQVLKELPVETGEFDWRVIEGLIFTPLHSDPRWQSLTDRVNLVSSKPDHIKLDVPTPVQWQ
jgi:adenylate cyclase